MATGETRRVWMEKNVMRVVINLNRTNDADIVEALARAEEQDGEGKATAMKRWTRIGIEADSKK